MNRAEWLEERKKGIGASEAAAILGVSKWASPVSVWAEKKGFAPPREDSLRLKVGRLLEEPVARLYAEREGVELTGDGMTTVYHPGGLHVFATADRLVVGRSRGVECKTVDARMADDWGEDGSDGVPIYYVPQGVIGMAVHNLPEWDYAALIGFDDFRVFRLVRDLELENEILSRCDAFFVRYVMGNEEPALDGSEACAAYLAQKYQRNTLPLIGANEEAEQLLKDLFAIKDQVKADEAIQTEYENRLKAIIGEAEGIQGICGKALWRKNKDSEKTEWEAVARALNAPSDLIAQHTIIRPGPRVFRPTPAKR